MKLSRSEGPHRALHIFAILRLQTRLASEVPCTEDPPFEIAIAIARVQMFACRLRRTHDQRSRPRAPIAYAPPLCDEFRAVPQPASPRFPPSSARMKAAGDRGTSIS